MHVRHSENLQATGAIKYVVNGSYGESCIDGGISKWLIT
jgi:hypothetical protein